MIVGHYAASMVAKVAEPRVPLWHYVVAAQLIDFAWAAFVLVGIEEGQIVDQYTKSFPFDFYFMPYSHSLIAVLAWFAIAAVAYRLAKGREFTKGAILIGLVVASHWLFDLIVHPADLPLFSLEQKVGFAMWNYPMLSLLIELVFVVGALVLLARHYRMSTQATLATILALMVVMFLIHLTFFFNLNPRSIYIIASLVFGGYVLFTFAADRFEKRFDASAVNTGG